MNNPRAFQWNISTNQWDEVKGFSRTPGIVIFVEGWCCIAVLDEFGRPSYIPQPASICDNIISS